MTRETDIENAIKAAQTADLLLSDLRELNRTGGPVLSMMVLPEIQRAAELKTKLEGLASALKSEMDEDVGAPAPSA